VSRRIVEPAEAEELVPFPRIDPDKNQIIAVFGRKGAGKSVMARETFLSWPGVDKLVIDPTGDADPGPGATTVRTLPATLPTAGRRGEHTVTRWIADPASPTYAGDVDRALELALYPKDRRVLVWVDEAAEIFPAGGTGPAGRLLLRQSRHWYTSLILCNPRPIGLDPLCLSQADRVVMYDLPHPRDRERIAEAIGVPSRELAPLLDQLRHLEHWFLMYIAAEHQMYLCEPLPMSTGHRHAQQ
jgi:hypothetical protein